MSLPSVFSNLLNNTRTPKAIVTVNGIQVLWISLEINTTTYYVADTFHVELPLLSQPAPFDINYWSSTPQFKVQIYVGFPPIPDFFSTTDLDLLFVGIADDFELDPLSGRVLLSGRDLTSLFIDTKSTQKFANLTASTIATNFAVQHGLTPVVTKTNVKVGVFYQNAQVLLTKSITQWDLLTFLAQQSDFVVFVQQNNLIFEPRPLTSDNPYLLNIQLPSLLSPFPQYNGQQLGLFRSMTLATDVIVKIKVPYSTRSGKSFTVSARSTHRPRTYLPGVPPPDTKPQRYSFIIPGLTKEQAQQRANQTLKNITQHEIRLTTVVPGDNMLKKDSLLKLVGTNSAFDQYYYSESVIRRMSIVEGYAMEITCKNHSVDSEVLP